MAVGLISAAYVLLASLAGIWLAGHAPWRRNIRTTHVPKAVGVALGPFLLGLICVALLALPFEKSHEFFVYAPLVLLSIPALFGMREARRRSNTATPPLLGVPLLYLLFGIWAFALIFNASVYVLTQNDALEYAMVGRLLFETGSLSSYPAISPETSVDGFYGPWTHPPLYVAMIALANFVQGHADTPGLMRLISPWFLLAATYGVWALGSLINKRVGILAAIILISTPLLFLGTDSALLDALTVCSFALLMSVLSGLDFGHREHAKARQLGAGIALGSVIGMGMWAHSQTILYLPVGLFVLAMITGLKAGSGFCRIAGSAVVAAFIVASPPYLRNLAIMGTLISDEPAVFALEVLDWKGYFDFARGLDHPIAVIQYGLFKGWFSLEAYGLSYWFMTIGLCFVASGTAFPRSSIWNPKVLNDQAGKFLLWTASVLFLCYFAGTFLSVLLGMNLMIKNERYLLTTLPAVAVIGGYGLERVSTWLTKYVQELQSNLRDVILASLLVVEIFALSSFLVVGFYYRFRLLPPSTTNEINWDEADQSLLENRGFTEFLGKSFDAERAFHYFPSIQSVDFMNLSLPDDALVLAMRPADFYYLDRKMISYLDLRLLPIYEETDPKRVVEMLRDIGVTHIYMVDYALPPLYNSALAEVLVDPNLTTLVYDNQFFQLYALKPATKQVIQLNDFTPTEGADGQKWATRTRFVLGGRKALSSTGGEFTLLDDSGMSEKSQGLFHRDYTTFLIPTEINSNGLRIPLFLDLMPGQEYIVEFEVEGRGFLRFWVEIYDDDNGVLRRGIDNSNMRIFETVLNDRTPRRTIKRRFKAAPWAKKAIFRLEQLGKSKLHVRAARLYVIDSETASEAKGGQLQGNPPDTETESSIDSTTAPL